MSPYHPLNIPFGLTVWSIWFVLLYGGLSLGCELAPPEPELGPWNWLNASLGLYTIGTVAMLYVFARYCWHAAKRVGKDQPVEYFVAIVAAALHLVAAFAALFIGLPLARLPPCI